MVTVNLMPGLFSVVGVYLEGLRKSLSTQGAMEKEQHAVWGGDHKASGGNMLTQGKTPWVKSPCWPETYQIVIRNEESSGKPGHRAPALSRMALSSNLASWAKGKTGFLGSPP